MKKNRPLLKKRIAKEILLFFGAIGLVGLCWSFFVLRNKYYESRKVNLNEEIGALTTQVDSLKKDKISTLYNDLNINFIVTYKIDNDKYAIPKKEEKDFLNDNPNAIHQANYAAGYSYFKLKSISIKPNENIKFYDTEDLGKKIKSQYKEYADIPNNELGQKVLKKFPLQNASTIVFDFVDLENFKELLTHDDYIHNFYSIFKSEKYIVDKYTDAGLPIFKRFDIGTYPTFESEIKLALKNDKTISQTKDKLSAEIDQIKQAPNTIRCQGSWPHEPFLRLSRTIFYFHSSESSLCKLLRNELT